MSQLKKRPTIIDNDDHDDDTETTVAPETKKKKPTVTATTVVYVVVEHKTENDRWSSGTGRSSVKLLGTFLDFDAANRVAFETYKKDIYYQYLLEGIDVGSVDVDVETNVNKTGVYVIDNSTFPDEDSRIVNKWLVEKQTVQ